MLVAKGWGGWEMVSEVLVKKNEVSVIQDE